MPDPRDPRGVRYPLAALLTVAVCAVTAGASSFAAITDWLNDLDEPARDRLGFHRVLPAGTTVWRPAGDALPTDLQDWARREWLIENQIHHVRDVTFREDLHQARTGTGPAILATLRNTAIGYHRTNGDTNIARATRRANRRPHDLIHAVTSRYPRKQ